MPGTTRADRSTLEAIIGTGIAARRAFGPDELEVLDEMAEAAMTAERTSPAPRPVPEPE
ncbi:MAG: hypothetical protein ACYDH5_20330 [Acidimicrobiales bacterium]